MNHNNTSGCEIDITEYHAKTAGRGLVVFIVWLVAVVLFGALVITQCATGV